MKFARTFVAGLLLSGCASLLNAQGVQTGTLTGVLKSSDQLTLPGATVAVTSSATGGAEGATEWEFIQKHKPYAVDLVLSEERVRYMQRINLELGLQKRLLPYDQVADMTLAQDALKLMG